METDLSVNDVRALADVSYGPKDQAAAISSGSFRTDGMPFGGGTVNQTMLQVMFPALPFGGVGASGMGRYYGKAGFDSLSQTKSIVYSDPDVAIEELLPPYSDSESERLSALLTP